MRDRDLVEDPKHEPDVDGDPPAPKRLELALLREPQPTDPPPPPPTSPGDKHA